MASLTDLFNPTFLMFLGILVLVVALLVVYFETKFREQNHKISSMLSLVSSLAEEVNGSKMIIHQLTMNHQPHSQQFFQQQQQPNLEKRIVQNDNLILVSDDEDGDSDSDAGDSDSDAGDSDSDAASEVSIDENVDDDDDDSDIELGDHSNDVKVLKLNISDNNDENSESGDDLEEMDDLEGLEDLDDSSTSSVSIKEEKNDNIKSMDFKSINITLEETKPEQPLDYRKMALPKLRSIVSEKGLSSDSSKLKKNELLKLLGAE